MVYLPAGLSRTKSQNASNLYQSQAAAGVVPPAQPDRPLAPPQPGGGVPASAEGGFTPATAQAPSRITEYLQAQQQQRGALEARGQDLRLAQMMAKALDPAMPKGFRQLGLKQISQMLGVDPKGDRSKEIINTISSLDPQSLEGVRRGVVGAVEESSPGELTETTRGILTGQVPTDKLLEMAQVATAPPAPSSSGSVSEEDAPMMRLGAGGLAGAGGDIGGEGGVTMAQAPGQAPLPGAPLPPRDTGPARMPFEAAPPAMIPRYQGREVSPRLREVVPELSSLLGLSADQAYRNIDLIRGGWDRIPSDEEGQQRLATDIRGNQAGVIDTITMASQLAGLVRGNPEALNAFTFRPQGLDPITLNLPSVAGQVTEFLRGMGRLAGVPDRGTEQWSEFVRQVETDPRNRAFTDRLAANITRWAQESGQRIGDAAELNARINSIMVPLAFAMAAAKGQTGRFLSDRDVALQLQELGASANPAAFEAAIRDMVGRVYSQYNVRMRTHTGGEVPIVHAIPDDVASTIVAGGVAPSPLVRLLSGSEAPPAPRAPVQVSGTPSNLTGVPTASTTPDRDPTIVGPDPEPMQGEATSIPRGAIPAAPTAPAVPLRRPPIERRTLDRTSPTIEEESEGARQRAAEDRAGQLEARTQSRRRLDIAESAEARAERAELDQRRARIQQAFANIGAALRGAISVGGGGAVGAAGGDQDPAAFRIGAPAQRRPPTPVPAAPYQPQAPTPRRRPR